MFFNLYAVASLDTVGKAKKLTKIIIENKTSLAFKIQGEVTSDFIFEGYYSQKPTDTLFVYSHSPFRIVCSSLDSARQYVYFTFILNPGETVYLEKRPDKIFAHSNLGEVRNNELAFFVRMQESVGNFEGLLYYIQHKRSDAVNLLQKVEELYARRLVFLDNYVKQYSISNTFETVLKGIFFYKQYIEFFDHCYLGNAPSKQLVESQIIKDFIKKLEEAEDNQNSIYYVEAMYWKYRYNYQNAADSFYLYKMVRKQLHEQTLEIVFYKILELYMKKPEMKDILKDFLQICTSEDLANKVKSDYAHYLKNNLMIDVPRHDPSKIALLYHLETGKVITWEELTKGEGIKYLEFWATWCGGCRMDIPYSKKIQELYQKKGLKVLYISIDDNSGAWAEVSRKEGIPDANSYLLLRQSESYIRGRYKMVSIPRYMIVDRNGKVLNASAFKPLDSRIYTSLDKLLL